MIIASQKRRENIAEYLLYMWQIEDIIRANNLDIEKIKKSIIDNIPDISDSQRREITEWYESMIDMMRSENVTENGHLQINRNIMSELVDLHRSLLADPKFADYSALFYQTLPYIVELRARAGKAAEGEIETCFTALYGLLLLRLQGKDITPQTADAIRQISKLVATLSAWFHKNETSPIFAKEK